jgi:hypothetical protein
MANFLLTYHGEGGMPQGEAEQAAVVEAWNAWFARLGDALVDPGNPTGGSKAIAPDGSVMDATSAPTGYTILAADTLDAAVDLARGCPVLGAGLAVVVSETVPVM